MYPMMNVMLLTLVWFVSPCLAKLNELSGESYLWDRLIAENKDRKHLTNPIAICNKIKGKVRPTKPKLLVLFEKYGIVEQALHIILKYAVLCFQELAEMLVRLLEILGEPENKEDRKNARSLLKGKLSRTKPYIPSWLQGGLLGGLEKLGKLDEIVRKAALGYAEDFRYFSEKLDYMYRQTRGLARPFAKKHGFDRCSTWTILSKSRKKAPKKGQKVLRVPYAVPVKVGTGVSAQSADDSLPWKIATIILAVLLSLSLLMNVFLMIRKKKKTRTERRPKKAMDRDELSDWEQV